MSYVADQLTAVPAPGSSLLRRISAFLKAIVSKIDLSDFPRSCCS
ncbi:hypothetical protein [Bradyrhizobium aeschynomenes]|nr:hypothetical protein [Bradyrhizobium aeschynomenes]